MNTYTWMNKWIEKIEQKKMLFFAGVLFCFFVLAGVIFSKSTPTDPLSSLLSSVSQHAKQSISADFVTNEISPYSGPISASLSACMQNFSGEKTQKVYASFNPNFVLQQTPNQIVDDIAPVFGHAVKNSEIKWKWDPQSFTYIFSVAPNDEALWSCYFKTETTFLKSFFIPESVKTTLLPPPLFSTFESYRFSSNQAQRENSTSESSFHSTFSVPRHSSSEIR